MSQVKQKAIPRTYVETLTRKAVLQHTAQSVLEEFANYAPGDARWLINKLPTIVKHELLSGFQLVAYSDGEPVTSVRFKLDWKEHKLQQEIKSDFDVADLEDGKTHASTREVVGLVHNYLKQVHNTVPNVHYEVWFTRNGVARKQLGAEKYYELLGIEGSLQREIQDALAYAPIAAMNAARRAREIFFPGAEEASMDIR